MASDLIKDKSEVKFAKLLFNKGTDDALSFNCLIKEIKDEYVTFIGMSDYTDQVNAGAPIDIKIYSTNGVVAANATLLRVLKVGRSPFYTTTYPKPYDHTQKREYYRADMHLPVSLLVVKPDGSSRTIQATTKNISGRGMCFISLEPEFPQYYSITVQLQFKERIIVATADFVYTNTVLYKDTKLYVHAFKFIGIEPEEINFIIKECFLHQIEKSKKQA